VKTLFSEGFHVVCNWTKHFNRCSSFYITVGLGILSVHTGLGCHWLVAVVDGVLLGQSVHTSGVDFHLELGPTMQKADYNNFDCPT